MARDSMFGERVLWTGEPKVVTVPWVYRATTITCGIIAAVTTASAIAVAHTLHAPVGGMLFFAAWMATVAVGSWFFPRWWRSEFEYTITDRNIVMRRGKLRRYIDRRSISFARIHWHPNHPGIGDLELVRAVPTGALSRRLTVTLVGLVAPDRVWAFIRGLTPPPSTGEGERPLTQRLDDNERVIWSATPHVPWRHWVPRGRRAWWSTAISAILVLTGVVTTIRAVISSARLLEAGLEPASLSFATLVASFLLTVVLLLGSGGAILYTTIVRPALSEASGRYLLTNRRVLIQQGDEELHLDRTKIVDVIEAPSKEGRTDLYLVLDGPRARALASGGAFGEEAEGLQPVLYGVSEPEVVTTLLKLPNDGPESTPFPLAA